MQKIMFNERYGLTTAVLQGTKTMTRRIIPELLKVEDPDISEWGLTDGGKATITLYEGGRPTTDIFPMYQPGEVVAIAQSYKALGYTKKWVEQHISPNPNAKPTDPFEKKYPGWTNKMFVKASYMPHRIRITDIKVERLQDICDEDCLKEGILHSDKYAMPYGITDVTAPNGVFFYYSSPREAFAALIDKVSGKGTWKCNPYELAYSFELVK
jgi:hypothetical protein